MKTKNLLQQVSAVGLLLFSMSSFAIQTNVVEDKLGVTLNRSLPTSLVQGIGTLAYYTLTNHSDGPLWDIQLNNLPDGVSLITYLPGINNICSDTINLAPNGYDPLTLTSDS